MLLNHKSPTGGIKNCGKKSAFNSDNFRFECFFSSPVPEPLAHGELLWSLDFPCELCVVRHQQLLQRTSPLKLLVGILPNLAGMILIWPSLILVQMVPFHCISRPHRLKIDFEIKTLKIFLPKTRRPRALIFGM